MAVVRRSLRCCQAFIYFSSREGILQQHSILNKLSQRLISLSARQRTEHVTVAFKSGFPVISIPLPSRRETCEFTLRPLSHTVRDFLQDLQAEDRGIERAIVYNEDGSRISGGTGVDVLLQSNFKLVLNDDSYLVSVPDESKPPIDDFRTVAHIKTLVHQLYSAMNIEEHQLEKERHLMKELEKLQLELKPLEELKTEIESRSAKRTTAVVWGGLAYMALQFGLLARLTWWEYSWDIMEPVTYFVGYGTAMAAYAYFILTRQEFMYNDARDRQFLMFFHKLSRRKALDVKRYNEIKDSIARIEDDLNVLRSPLFLHLPEPARLELLASNVNKEVEK
ncbi:PREDICTED: calcium uniporter protein, mitochondrial-like [Acropora digitifera]|uniref:calcium uniporter protein, mitochondrial-like n=1 Tax=Acropora digitifera TaxID=70779 RepID=UPI00077AF873|nr:PREDICTED: calcium uniporter protein, mitochondrial-like [Acropora digitifera]